MTLDFYDASSSLFLGIERGESNEAPEPMILGLHYIQPPGAHAKDGFLNGLPGRYLQVQAPATSQPLRYSLWTNLDASGAFVAFKFLASHASFWPVR